MKLGFVFTNYNNSHYTRKVIHSISLNSNWNDTYVVIVDNKSEETDIDSLNLMKQDYPSIHLILNEINSGYFKGLNIGITYLRNNYIDIDHIVIGNNDLVFPPNFITNLHENKLIFEKYAVISPNLITMDGVHQNPHVIERISKFRELIYDIYYTNYYFSILIGYLAKITKKFTDRKDEEQFDIAQPIFQGYGACYILSPIFFKFFKDLWAPTFLMGEEFFLSYQLQKENLKIYYEPKIVVNHLDHSSIKKIQNREFWKISRQSHKIYRKYKPIYFK